jgi:hypothetical protein
MNWVVLFGVVCVLFVYINWVQKRRQRGWADAMFRGGLSGLLFMLAIGIAVVLVVVVSTF